MTAARKNGADEITPLETQLPDHLSSGIGTQFERLERQTRGLVSAYSNVAYRVNELTLEMTRDRLERGRERDRAGTRHAQVMGKLEAMKNPTAPKPIAPAVEPEDEEISGIHNNLDLDDAARAEKLEHAARAQRERARVAEEERATFKAKLERATMRARVVAPGMVFVGFLIREVARLLGWWP